VEENIGKYTGGGTVGMWKWGDGKKPWFFVLDTGYSVTHKRNSNVTNTDNLLAAYVYVLFRSQKPDEEKEKKMLRELKDNLDENNILKFRADHCQFVE
jgi:uncharacterized membrane protein YgaE (UPF0421/DUF939 family)